MLCRGQQLVWQLRREVDRQRSVVWQPQWLSALLPGTRRLLRGLRVVLQVLLWWRKGARQRRQQWRHWQQRLMPGPM